VPVLLSQISEVAHVRFHGVNLSTLQVCPEAGSYLRLIDTCILYQQVCPPVGSEGRRGRWVTPAMALHM